MIEMNKDETVIKNIDGTEYILNTKTMKIRPLPIDKQQITTQWDSANFADSIIKLAKEEFNAGKHKTLIDAYDSVINQYPEGYEQYSKENTKVCRGN